jgi:tryptophan-rich sensory protein
MPSQGARHKVWARQAGALMVFVLLVYLVSATGAFFTGQSVDDWYNQIKKPSWTPPGSVIGTVWFILYATIALSGWLVWRKRHSAVTWGAMMAWGAQLVLNALWSFCFFGLRNPSLAFGELVLLWLAILITVLMAYRISKPAAYLLLPYIAWVTFAGFLNLHIWLLNR